MADDIVTRLRDTACETDVCWEAADEIEQLRALADQLARALLDGPFRGDRRDRMYGSDWAEVHNALDAYEEARGG